MTEEAVEKAVVAFLRFRGAIAINREPVDDFSVAPAAIRAAIQAYIDEIKKDVGSCGVKK